MARILLTDGQERSVLAATRCLHRAGYEVAVAASAPLAMAQWSRDADERPITANPRTRPAQFLDDLERIVRTGRYDVLVLGSDAALRSVLDGRERLERHVRIGLPGDEALRRTLDRVELASAAATVGLESPPTLHCRGASEARTALHRLGPPVMLKTRWPVVNFDHRLDKIKSRVIMTASALEAALPSFGDECLVQAVVDGEEISCAGVMTDEGLMGLAVSRYERMWPVVAGDVSFSETIAFSDQLRSQVESLLRKLGWVGIFELEMIRLRDGHNAAIDLNPRLYGSLALAVRAGAPLPSLWCDWLLGRPTTFAAARPGLRYRREDGDVAHAIWQARRGHWGAAMAAVRPRTRVSHALFSVEDPLPLLIRMLEVARSRIPATR